MNELDIDDAMSYDLKSSYSGSNSSQNKELA